MNLQTQIEHLSFILGKGETGWMSETIPFRGYDAGFVDSVIDEIGNQRS
jgi:hypothetical protein